MPFLRRWAHQGEMGFLDWISAPASSFSCGSAVHSKPDTKCKVLDGLVPRGELLKTLRRTQGGRRIQISGRGVRERDG